ncbi:MAG: glycosyltransferase family 39 protein [Planctomycetes bacterium]|nr:glycosyltransferase family 39 protein [Planctomycetota bacterium]
MVSVSKKFNGDGDGVVERNFIYIAVLFFIIAGVFFRFLGIGKWCFAIDEFFTASSVSSILDNGIPGFEHGGYYVRGLFFQYFEALLSLVFGFSEASLRYGSVFFNLLTIPGLYFLGRKMGGAVLGLAATGIFSISLVEIEMSRYIRMYTAFQCIFIWYLLVQIKVIVDQDSTKIKWLYIIAICSVFVHEGAVFPIILLFLPLLFDFPGNKRIHVLVSFAILCIAFLYLTFDFRHFGTTAHLPQDYQGISGASMILLPRLYFLNTIFETKWWLTAYVVIVFVGSLLVYRIWKDKGPECLRKSIITLLMLLGMLHMFGLIILIISGALIIDKINTKDIGNKTVKLTIGFIGITFCFWFLYGAFSDIWLRNFPNVSEISAKKILVVLFKYPNVFDAFVFPWSGNLPYVFIFLFLSLLYIFFIRIAKKQNSDSPLCVITISVITCICFLGIIATTYARTRYSFFLYPVVILLILFVIKAFINHFDKIKYRTSIFFFISMFLFMASGDFNLKHLTKISSPETNFRMDYGAAESDHLMVRRDFKSPAQFINRHFKSKDIIIIKTLPCSFYLKQTDYVFLPYSNIEYPNLSIQKGTRELWTSAELLSRFDAVSNLVKNAQHTVWVIDYSEKFLWKDEYQDEFNKNYLKYKAYTSMDGVFNVLKIPPASGRHI